jgi:hypothetical protein
MRYLLHLQHNSIGNQYLSLWYLGVFLKHIGLVVEDRYRGQRDHWGWRVVVGLEYLLQMMVVV